MDDLTQLEQTLINRAESLISGLETYLYRRANKIKENDLERERFEEEQIIFNFIVNLSLQRDSGLSAEAIKKLNDLESRKADARRSWRG